MKSRRKKRQLGFGRLLSAPERRSRKKKNKKREAARPSTSEREGGEGRLKSLRSDGGEEVGALAAPATWLQRGRKKRFSSRPKRAETGYNNSRRDGMKKEEQRLVRLARDFRRGECTSTGLGSERVLVTWILKGHGNEDKTIKNARQPASSGGEGSRRKSMQSNQKEPPDEKKQTNADRRDAGIRRRRRGREKLSDPLRDRLIKDLEKTTREILIKKHQGKEGALRRLLSGSEEKGNAEDPRNKKWAHSATCIDGFWGYTLNSPKDWKRNGSVSVQGTAPRGEATGKTK